ncbi:serine hydrolase [Chloroflexota bacterium]
MAIKCQLCGFEAKTAQGLAGHRRLLHTQAAQELERQATELPYCATDDDAGLDNQSVMPGPLDKSEQMKEKLGELEDRFKITEEATASLETKKEQKIKEHVNMAMAALLSRANQTASAMLSDRLAPIARLLDTVAAKQGFLETKGIGRGKRLGKVEAYVELRCTNTIPPEDLAELLPRIYRRNTVK